VSVSTEFFSMPLHITQCIHLTISIGPRRALGMEKKRVLGIEYIGYAIKSSSCNIIPFKRRTHYCIFKIESCIITNFKLLLL